MAHNSAKYRKPIMLSWNTLLFGTIMKMLNYEFVEVIIPQSISERPNYGVESITREQFLFYEMSNIVLLMREGLSDEENLIRGRG